MQASWWKTWQETDRASRLHGHTDKDILYTFRRIHLFICKTLFQASFKVKLIRACSDMRELVKSKNPLMLHSQPLVMN